VPVPGHRKLVARNLAKAVPPRNAQIPSAHQEREVPLENPIKRRILNRMGLAKKAAAERPFAKVANL
jgi:hypothetical protein